MATIRGKRRREKERGGEKREGEEEEQDRLLGWWVCLLHYLTGIQNDWRNKVEKNVIAVRFFALNVLW